MANIKSAIKRARQNDKRRAHNTRLRSRVRTYVKKLIQIISDANKDEANNLFPTVQKMLDKAAAKKLIHKNKAARIKSQLSGKIKNLSQAGV